MYSIEHNYIFIALVATSFSHYNHYQANAVQNLKSLVIRGLFFFQPPMGYKKDKLT
jgi:hypothetical protein